MPDMPQAGDTILECVALIRERQESYARLVTEEARARAAFIDAQKKVADARAGADGLWMRLTDLVQGDVNA